MRLRPHLPIALLLALGTPAAGRSPSAAPVQDEAASATPARLLDVVDGDTLHVLLEGQRVTLRLAAVDTEEKISGRPNGSPSKPQTIFGQETSLWAKDLFGALGEAPEIGLLFPEGRKLDAYGRLLCHVLLPDGSDFNLRLVREGWSPYFNKYGNSPIAHEAFVAAQQEAHRAQRGIWNPATNRPANPAAPAAVRPYARLLPWWEARAQAIDGFRRRRREDPDTVLAGDDTQALAAALERCRLDPSARLEVFTPILRFYEEPDGSLTALLQGGNRGQALRAAVLPGQRARLEPLLRASVGEFRQNYLWVTGRVTRDRRGFRLDAPEGLTWQVAAPPFPPR